MRPAARVEQDRYLSGPEAIKKSALRGFSAAAMQF
jgi:hypothetical protein